VKRRTYFNVGERLSPVWTLHNKLATAVCELWSHEFGFELRLAIAGELVRTTVCRTHEDLFEICKDWKEAMTESGWVAV
jgi:hypothetical protein